MVLAFSHRMSSTLKKTSALTEQQVMAVMYGDWESALYQYDFKKSDAEKARSRKDALRVFEDRK